MYHLFNLIHEIGGHKAIYARSLDDPEIISKLALIGIHPRKSAVIIFENEVYVSGRTLQGWKKKKMSMEEFMHNYQVEWDFRESGLVDQIDYETGKIILQKRY